MVLFEIKNPKGEEADPATFAQILANFANQSPPSLLSKLIGHRAPVIILEIAVYKQTIHFFLACEDYLKSYFQSQLSSQYPKAQILESRDYLPFLAKNPALAAGELVLRGSTYLPINTFRAFKDIDPLRSVLGIMAKFGSRDAGVFQLVLQPCGTGWQEGARAMITKGIVESKVEGGRTITRRRPLPNERVMNEKISLNGLKTGLRLLAGSNSLANVQRLLGDFGGAFGVYARGDGNALTLKHPGSLSRERFKDAILKREAKYIPRGQVLNIEEIASLYHPAGEALSGVKNIAWGGQLLSEAPENLPIGETDAEKKEINFIARTEFKNKINTFGIKVKDRRRHVYVIGKTGTGKTTLIANMAIDDMKKGRGLAVIDPHGDLCDILLDYIPRSRINDVAYLDPSDAAYPFKLNPLELSGQESTTQAELVASGIVSIFHKLYHYSWGPRMEYILRNTLLTLTQVPNSTLIDVPRILAEPKFRHKIVSKLSDQILVNYWKNEYDKMSEKLRAEAVSPIQNKVGQFVSSPMIRNILNHPRSTVDFAQMMDEGKIIIANLSQGKLGEDNAALMGAMFITKMQLAAMSRAYRKEEERRDFYLYVDEFQNFATQSFIKILSEARKFRLNLTLANQYIGQVDEEVRKAIFGNVGTLLSFLVGAEDARRLNFEYGEEYEQKDFVSLGKFQILLKMAIDDVTSNPFYATTLPLPRSKNKNRAKVVRVSRERYSRKK